MVVLLTYFLLAVFLVSFPVSNFRFLSVCFLLIYVCLILMYGPRVLNLEQMKEKVLLLWLHAGH